MDRYLSIRNWLLAAALLLGGLAFLASRNLHYERDVERFFPNAADRQAYKDLKLIFGGNEIVLAVYEDPELLASNGVGLQRLRAIRERIEALPGVSRVLSLDRALGNWIVQSDPALVQRLQALFEGYTHGSDGKTVALACMLDTHSKSTLSRQTTLAGLRAIMDSLPASLGRGYLTGEPVLVAEGVALVEQDGARLGAWSLGLLGLTIAICFRKLRWVVLPLVTVQLSIWLTRALLAAVGMQLSMVSSMLTAVVTVVGVATVVHIVVHYEQSLRECGDPREALRASIRSLAAPIFWAIVTDAVGFLALTVSGVTPVRDFGIMMGVGSIMVLFVVVAISPAIILWRASSQSVPTSRLDAEMERTLVASIPWIFRWRVPLALVLFSSLLVASCGGMFLDVETDFTKNFRRGSPLVSAYQVVEDKLGGAGVCDIIIPAPATLDWPFLNQVRHLQNDLERQFGHGDASDRSGLTKILSLDDAIRAVMNLSNRDEMEPSVVRNLALQGTLAQLQTRLPEFYRALYAKDAQGNYFYRIMLRARERQPAAAKQSLIANLKRTVASHFPQAHVTGFFVLLSGMIASVLRDQWTTFATAVVGIACVMGIALRDWRLVVMAMIPNVFPIMCIMGMMGWMQYWQMSAFKLNMGAAMIAAVSLGLSIDTSIHYLMDYQRGLERHETMLLTLQAAQSKVGQAMIFSTLALMVGFAVLCTSDFIPTVYFGVLVSLSMLGSLLGNLILIPLQLSLMELWRTPRADQQSA